MPATAIDIGTHNIKALTGKPGSNPKIEKIISTPNTTGIDYPSNDPDAEKLLNFLQTFIQDYKIPTSDVRLSLPEAAIATKIIDLPPLNQAELASAIDWQAEQHIPIALENLALEYKVLYKPPKNIKDEPMKVLLVGTRKDIVERYTNVFLNLGIQPKILETQILSVIRALGFEKSDPNTLVAHIGASHTQLAIISQAQLKLVVNHQSGGNLLTKRLQQNIENLNSEQAEQYKKQYGLIPDQLQGKIYQALLPAVDGITKDIQKTLRFYNSQNPNDEVIRLVLSGGTANLPGLIEHLAKNTNTEVLLISPFATVEAEVPPDIDPRSMSVCMGLIMRKD